MSGNIHSYRYEDGYNNEDEYEDGYNNEDEYEPGTLFLSLPGEKPFEDLTEDEFIERIDALRSYMIDLSNRVEAESDEVLTLRTLYPKGIFSEKRDLQILLSRGMEAYETKTLFGAYVMYLNVLTTDYLMDPEFETNGVTLPFDNYYDLVKYRIYGFPTEKTALDIFDAVSSNTSVYLQPFYISKIKVINYNLNNAVKSAYKN